MYIPDFMIAEMCGNNFPRTWSPAGGPDLGRELSISDPGPVISPFDQAALGPASYDFQIGTKFASPQALQAFVVRDGARLRSVGSGTEVDGAKELRQGEQIEIVLEPKQAVLCHSAEYVRVPPHLVGVLSMRSSFARDWLDHSAATTVWPGFQGNITFELRNDGPRPYILRSGMRVLQLAFIRMAATPACPYNGIYQKQNGQLHSRMPKDAA